MASADSLPVLIGAGQVVDRWPEGAGERDAPSPLSMAVNAGRKALADTGRVEAVSAAIDAVATVRFYGDSLFKPYYPFGRCANPPGSVASDLGLNPARTMYSAVGGHQPQALINTFARELFEGTATAVLVVGGEAMRTQKAALKAGQTLDWSRSADGDFEDGGRDVDFVSARELQNGLGRPPQSYGVLENAYRRRLGLSKAA